MINYIDTIEIPEEAAILALAAFRKHPFQY